MLKTRKERDVLRDGFIIPKLKEIAARKKLELIFNIRGPDVEIFKIGEEAGTIYYHNEGGGIEEDGVWCLYVDCFEYKRITWWREFWENAKIPFDFYDMAVGMVAKEAGVVNWQEAFDPPTVVAKYKLARTKDWMAQEKAEEWVEDKIVELLEPLVAPDYTLEISYSAVRLLPETARAIKSRVEDNTAYKKLMKTVKSIVPALEKAYKEKAKAKTKMKK